MPVAQDKDCSRNEHLIATMRAVKQIKLLKNSLENTIGSTNASKTPDPDEVRYCRSKHLSIKQPTKKITFADLSLPVPDSATSEIAATEPFSLFSPESIPLLRKAVLNEKYIARTGSIFGPKTLIVRNTAAHSPFFRHMMNDPYMLQELSKAAGVELEPVMETMELGHANVQVNFAAYSHIESDDEKMKAAARDLCAGKYIMTPLCRKAVATRPEEEIERELQGALLPWHLDSYPWVCVAMISDTTEMVGGETVIKTGTGSYRGIAQPGAGSAMMLQGGLIKHLALSTIGGADRITLITSFRSRSPLHYDSSFMSNIRPYSDLPQLYLQWIEYRLARIKPGLARLVNKRRFTTTFDDTDYEEEQVETIALREYTKRTLRQMVKPDLVFDLVQQHGRKIFYSIRDDYVSGDLFKHPLNVCIRCDDKEAKVDKHHLAVCAGAAQWRPSSSLWQDRVDTERALEENGLELAKRCEELQVKDVIRSWAMEMRPWGIADELAVQGLNEYLLEFLHAYELV